MEKMPTRQLARQCCVFGLSFMSLLVPTNSLTAQEEPRVANRSPLQFGKNYWPSRPASSTAKPTSESPQPGIFRGGLVQQLRSITSSVLGDGETEQVEDAEVTPQGAKLDSIPSPPSLNDLIDAPAYNEEMESFQGDEIEGEFPDIELDSPESDFDGSKTLEGEKAPSISNRPARAPGASTSPPAMPMPAAPGQSRWRNQKSQPTPLNAMPARPTNPSVLPKSSNSSSGRAVPIAPRGGATSSNDLPSATSPNTSGRRPAASTNSSAVPVPPSLPKTSTVVPSPTTTESAAKPLAEAPQPSRTNSSRRVTTTKDRLNSNEITLPTAQVTELDESRIKVSDKAPVSSSSTATGADAPPLVSKKLPPGRPKAPKEPSLTLPAVVSKDAGDASATTPSSPEISASQEPSPTTTNSGAGVGSNRQMSLSSPSSATPSTVDAAKSATSTNPTGHSFDMEIPSVLVRLAGPSDIPVGRKGEYELITQNTGTIPLNGVIIRMDIPKGVTTEIEEALKAQTETEVLEDGSLAIVWQVSEIGPGKLEKLPIKLMAAEARNFAIAMEWTVMPQSGELLVQVQKPDLQIGLEGPAEVAYGVPQMYRLKISNPGTAPAENVTLNLAAEPYGSNSSPLGTIAPGTNRVVEVELTFQQKGKLKIKAEAVADNLKAVSEVDVVVQQAVLEATLSGAESEYIGATVSYQMELKNSGDTAAENVIAQIELPEGVKLAQLPEGARLSGRILLWDVASLPVGQSQTFSWQAELLTAGEKLFQATCRGSAGASVVAQTQTRVEAVADLKLTLSDPPSPSPVGEEVVYELQITNRGKQAANKVKILAQFSEGIEPSGAIGAEHKLVPGQVLFEPIPSIAAGDTIKLQVRALASEAGVHRFRIEVQTDDEEIHHVLEESTRYMQTASRPTGTKLR